MKRKFVIVIIFITLMSFSGLVNAANWELVLSDKDNQFYVDIDSIVLYDSELTFWGKAEHTDSFKYSGVKTFFSLQKINLATFTYELKKSVAYLESGQVLSNESKQSPQKLEPLAPLTYMAGTALSSVLSNYQWTDAGPGESFKVSFGIYDNIYFWNKTVKDDGNAVYSFNRLNKISNTTTDLIALIDEKEEKNDTFIGPQVLFFNLTSGIKPNTPFQRIVKMVISNWEAENL